MMNNWPIGHCSIILIHFSLIKFFNLPEIPKQFENVNGEGIISFLSVYKKGILFKTGNCDLSNESVRRSLPLKRYWKFTLSKSKS